MLFPSKRLILLSAPVLACVLPPRAARAEPNLSLTEAWELALQLRVKEAHRAFTSPAAEAFDRRETELGRAATLLNLQPKTAANIAEASRRLESLARQEPPDAIAVEAALLHARIPHVHATPPDRAEALRRYEAVLARFPGDPTAELAAPRVALLRLYGPDPDDRRRATLEELADLARGLRNPVARRELERVLADAWLVQFGDDARALPHLLAADEIGIVRISPRLDHWLRIAEAARATGQTELATRYYRRFLGQSARDTRTALVRQRLAELEATAEETP